MEFARRDRVPDHWRTFSVRRSPLTLAPHSAANPHNAILNYLYTLLEVETRVALIARGLDPGLALFHADEAYRQSLAADVMEPGAAARRCLRTESRTYSNVLSQGLCRDARGSMSPRIIARTRARIDHGHMGEASLHRMPRLLRGTSPASRRAAWAWPCRPGRGPRSIVLACPWGCGRLQCRPRSMPHARCRSRPLATPAAAAGPSSQSASAYTAIAASPIDHDA
jgi:hypothetical protein